MASVYTISSLRLVLNYVRDETLSNLMNVSPLG